MQFNDNVIVPTIGLGAALGGWLGKTYRQGRKDKAEGAVNQQAAVLDNSSQAWTFVNQTIDRQSKMIDQLEDDKRRLQTEVDQLKTDKLRHDAELIELRLQLASAQVSIAELQRKGNHA